MTALSSRPRFWTPCLAAVIIVDVCRLSHAKPNAPSLVHSPPPPEPALVVAACNRLGGCGKQLLCLHHTAPDLLSGADTGVELPACVLFTALSTSPSRGAKTSGFLDMQSRIESNSRTHSVYSTSPFSACSNAVPQGMLAPGRHMVPACMFPRAPAWVVETRGHVFLPHQGDCHLSQIRDRDVRWVGRLGARVVHVGRHRDTAACRAG
eukprot:113945-Chlamydomonas_euryale.AAC.1